MTIVAIQETSTRNVYCLPCHKSEAVTGSRLTAEDLIDVCCHQCGYTYPGQCYSCGEDLPGTEIRNRIR